MSAYYNENNEYNARWLRNLIGAGHIAPGDVDTRSISDVKPDDLKNYKQCHFFAGIGVWSYALRLAGWPDFTPIWTGSCPCQPFSDSGKKAGFDDERHLWPDWFQLIVQCDPHVVMGEQVASKDGLAWLDLVQADMEAADYAFGEVDLCAAGVGAPHIRQRSWFVAERLGDTLRERLERHGGGHHTSIRYGQKPLRPIAKASEFIRMANAELQQQQACTPRRGLSGGWLEKPNTASGHSEISGPGDSDGERTGRNAGASVKTQSQDEGRSIGDATCSSGSTPLSGPTNGFWRGVDWLGCRDGKFRPVRPGTRPLADGPPERVGRLHAYGNAINAEVAKIAIEAYLESRP